MREDTIAPRERLVRRFLEFTNEYPWSWGPSHVDEWTQALTSERRLAPSTIRGYQMGLRLFSEYLCDGRYGWAAACEKEFGHGAHPVPVCHEWNTIAHLYGCEGNPECFARRRPTPSTSCSERDVSGFGYSLGYSKGHFMIGSGLWPGALGGTRTPNLLIRRSVRGVLSVRLHPYPQVEVHQLSRMDAGVRCCPGSP